MPALVDLNLPVIWLGLSILCPSFLVSEDQGVVGAAVAVDFAVVDRLFSEHREHREVEVISRGSAPQATHPLLVGEVGSDVDEAEDVTVFGCAVAEAMSALSMARRAKRSDRCSCTSESCS